MSERGMSMAWAWHGHGPGGPPGMGGEDDGVLHVRLKTLVLVSSHAQKTRRDEHTQVSRRFLGAPLLWNF